MIRKLEARAVRLPLSRPTRISTRALEQRDFLIVQVTSDNGDAVGVGYAYAGTSGGPLLAKTVDDLLAPSLIGTDDDDIVAAWDRLYQETLLLGRRGAVLRAMSAVDIALWDLAAKRRGVPLCVLLGGAVAPVPAYASGGYYRSDAGGWTDEVRSEIQRNRELGFADHKIKVGGLSAELDANRVRAATEAMEGVGRLALDANNAFATVHEARNAIRRYERAAEGVELWWIEEPLSPDDVDGHAQLAADLETPVATGEIHQTRWEFRQLIAAKAADILQPDAGVLGGVTEWMRVAQAAETFGVPIAPHWHANLHAHLAAATPNCLAVEHFLLEKDIYNFEVLLQPDSRLAVRDGNAILADRPGIGIEFDRSKLDQHSLKA